MSHVIEDLKEAVFSTIPGGNHAAWLDQKGEKLRVAKAQMPVPAADEIVIKNHAVAVNPVDWKIQDYGFIIQHWPTVLGCDVAGEVIEVGADVKRFKKHDRVIAHAIFLMTSRPQHGGFAQYTAVPEVKTALLPASVSYKEGSVLPLAISTAAVGLYRSETDGFLGLPYPSLSPVSIGKTIIIWGASSSVGAIAVQLAVASGAKVIAVASTHNHDFVRGLGASQVYDYSTPDVVDNVVKAIQTIGGTFGGVYDAISEEKSLQYVVPILTKLGGGNIATTQPVPEDKLPQGVRAPQLFAPHESAHPVWEKFVTPALESGQFKAAPEPSVVGKGLEFIQRGLDEQKKGVSAKKIVIEL